MLKYIILFILITVMCPTVYSQSNTDLTGHADSVYRKENWSEALGLYKELIAKEEKNGRFYYRAGICQLRLGKYSEAISYLSKAVTISNNPIAMYSLACAYNLISEQEKTYEWLDKAITEGYIGYRSMEKDEELASIRNENKFRELVKKARAKAEPCSVMNEYRQFDFWIGEWIVTYVGQQVGTSSIQLILGSCVIFENWSASIGGQGKNFNTFDQNTKKWKQTWVDDQGAITEFINGEYKDGKMVFYTANKINEDGSQEMRRLSFFNLGSDKVRQFSEISADGGSTWKTEYDFLYTRKN